jgi:hypothetical protein
MASCSCALSCRAQLPSKASGPSFLPTPPVKGLIPFARPTALRTGIVSVWCSELIVRKSVAGCEFLGKSSGLQWGACDDLPDSFKKIAGIRCLSPIFAFRVSSVLSQ